MSDNEEKLEQLLDEYEERKSQGETVTASDLCREFPDLLEPLENRIQRLNAINAFMTEPAKAGQLSQKKHWSLAEGDPLPAGRYRPTQFHAQGALGEIFIAKDEELDRPVALKRINREQAATAENCRRFEVEAMITGRLEHPGVVPVYGLGHDVDGQPVYAMRFIEGETFADAIARFHQLKGGMVSRDNVDFQQLLRRFLSLCQTVAYAHSRKVLHRDIKPANVMLGNFGETLLVDWGLAKLSEDVEPSGEVPPSISVSEGQEIDATEIGVVKGSPAYMSPEQAEGRSDLVGPESDIYSLGATLYHLLSGKMPFDGDTREVITRVREGKFPPPRQVHFRVPAALDAVCMKAMHRRPQHRYHSALQLASDLENWLADEPVSAWSEPIPVRCLRWVRHHRTLVVTLSVASAILMGSLIVSTALLSKKNLLLRNANQKTSEALAQTQEERGKAEVSLKSGLKAINAMLLRVGREGMDQVPEMQTVRREMLEDAVRFLEGFDGFEDRPELRREQGLAFQYLGQVQQLLSHGGQAERYFRRAIDLQQEIVNEFPDGVEAVQDLALSWRLLGVQLSLQNTQAAEDAFLKSMALLESLKGKLNGFELPLASVYNSLASLYSENARPQEALSYYDKSIELREKSDELADTADRDYFRFKLASSYHDLGKLHLIQGNLELAESSLLKTLDILKANPDDPILRRTYKNGNYEAYNTLAVLAQDLKQQDRAKEYHQKAIDVAKERSNLYPHVPGYKDAIARSRHNLGTLFIQSHQKEKALEEFKAAVAIRSELSKQFPDDDFLQVGYAESSASLAHVLSWVQDREAAVLEFRQAQKVLEALASRSPDVARYRASLCSLEINFGNLLRELGQLDESIAMHQRAVDHAKSVLDRDPKNAQVRMYSFSANGALANTLIMTDRHREAIPYCDKVVELAPSNQRDGWRLWRLLNVIRVDYVNSLDEIARLQTTFASSPPDQYNLVCVNALAAQAARTDVDSDAANRKELEAEFLENGFKLLSEIAATGFFESENHSKLLTDDNDLNSLRRDERWQEFVNGLRKTEQ